MKREILDTTIIQRNCLGDTRTANKLPTREEFRYANNMHIQDVQNICRKYAHILEYRGGWHDYTKIDAEDEFYNDFCRCLSIGDADFTIMPWYDKIHIVEERHHLLSNCPNDVNLIDVFEMIIDCVCAGMARSGSVRPIEIPNDILRKAVANTAKEIEESIVLEDSDA